MTGKSTEHVLYEWECRYAATLDHSWGMKQYSTHVAIHCVTCHLYHAGLVDTSQLVHNNSWSYLMYESVKPCMQPEQPSGLLELYSAEYI